MMLVSCVWPVPGGTGCHLSTTPHCWLTSILLLSLPWFKVQIQKQWREVFMDHAVFWAAGRHLFSSACVQASCVVCVADSLLFYFFGQLRPASPSRGQPWQARTLLVLWGAPRQPLRSALPARLNPVAQWSPKLMLAQLDQASRLWLPAAPSHNPSVYPGMVGLLTSLEGVGGGGGSSSCCIIGLCVRYWKGSGQHILCDCCMASLCPGSQL